MHNGKLYLTYGMVLCLVTLTDLQTRRAGLSASAELLVICAKARYLLRQRVWLAGWLGGWLSHSGIVSKRLNLSENLFDHLKAHHSSFLRPMRRYKIPRATPSAGALNTRGWENWRFSCDFRQISPFIAETVQDRPMITMER